MGSDESKSVGQGSDGEEPTGHYISRRIVEIERKNKDDLTDDDLSAMKKVHGYLERHLEQKPSKQDLETSSWRYSLMNGGHGPLK